MWNIIREEFPAAGLISRTGNSCRFRLYTSSNLYLSRRQINRVVAKISKKYCVSIADIDFKIEGHIIGLDISVNVKKAVQDLKCDDLVVEYEDPLWPKELRR